MQWLWLVLLMTAAWPCDAVEQDSGTRPCRLQGLEHDALCGSVRRPLDPAQPGGPQIDVQFNIGADNVGENVYEVSLKIDISCAVMPGRNRASAGRALQMSSVAAA